MKSITDCGSIVVYDATLIGATHQCQVCVGGRSLEYSLPRRPGGAPRGCCITPPYPSCVSEDKSLVLPEPRFPWIIPSFLNIYFILFNMITFFPLLFGIVIAAHRLSLVLESKGRQLSSCGAWVPHCSTLKPLCEDSHAVERGLSYPTACGVFPDKGLNSRLLHGQAAS